MEVLKKLVLDRENKAKFSKINAGVLYYTVASNDGYMYEFGIDMNDKEDVGTATFNAEEKAVSLMRYIRKSIQANTLQKVVAHVEQNGDINFDRAIAGVLYYRTGDYEFSVEMNDVDRVNEIKDELMKNIEQSISEGTLVKVS